MHSAIVDAMRAAMEVCPADQIQAYISGGGAILFCGCVTISCIGANFAFRVAE